MSDVTLHGVKKSYAGVDVIHNIDLDIPDKALAVLVGPSGCGKSTLLRMVAGLEDLTSGEIRIGGKLVNDLSPARRDIAMVFQSYALYPHMTAAENMEFYLRLNRVSKAERTERSQAIAGTVGISGLLSRFPRQLSGGQRQRVAMGRAIIREPQVFLFDEPLSNLDASLRGQMRAEIKSLQQRLETTAIYVTHDQIEAMTLADIIVVMRDGHIEQSGPPLEVFDRPANIFVASFIGSPPMNLVAGVIVTVDGQSHVAVGQSELPLERNLAGFDGRAVLFGIRPRDLEISDGNRDLAGVVELVESTGEETYGHIRVGSQLLLTSIPGRIGLTRGSPVRLRPRQGRVHLFDAATGKRIAEAG